MTFLLFVCQYDYAWRARLCVHRRCRGQQEARLQCVQSARVAVTNDTTWPNKLLVQVLKSCPSSDATPPVVLPNLMVPSLVEFIVSWLSKCIHWQLKLYEILHCSYYGSASVSKWAQKQLQFLKISWGSIYAPKLLSLTCLYTHTYKSDIHVTPLVQILATGLWMHSYSQAIALCIVYSTNNVLHSVPWLCICMLCSISTYHGSI